MYHRMFRASCPAIVSSFDFDVIYKLERFSTLMVPSFAFVIRLVSPQVCTLFLRIVSNIVLFLLLILRSSFLYKSIRVTPAFFSNPYFNNIYSSFVVCLYFIGIFIGFLFSGVSFSIATLVLSGMHLL